MDKVERLAQLAVEVVHLETALISLRKAILLEGNDYQRNLLTEAASRLAQASAIADKNQARIRAELHDAVEA